MVGRLGKGSKSKLEAGSLQDLSQMTYKPYGKEQQDNYIVEAAPLEYFSLTDLIITMGLILKVLKNSSSFVII